MGRRRFMKTSSSIGILAAALKHLSKETLAKVSDPSEEVPRPSVLKYTNKDEIESEGASGTLTAVYQYHGDFSTDARRTDGDSGGPHFKKDGSSVYIAGSRWGEGDGDNGDPSMATKIGAIENRFNVRV